MVSADGDRHTSNFISDTSISRRSLIGKWWAMFGTVSRFNLAMESNSPNIQFGMGSNSPSITKKITDAGNFTFGRSTGGPLTLVGYIFGRF